MLSLKPIKVSKDLMQEPLKFEKELKRIKNKKYIRTTFGEYFLT